MPHDLSYLNVLWAACLILISGVISICLRLKLERRLEVASVRTVVQLLLIGYVLQWLFLPEMKWYAIAALMVVMTLIAGVAAVRRTERRYPGI